MGLEQTKTDYMLRKAKMLFASGQLDEVLLSLQLRKNMVVIQLMSG